MFMQQCLAVSCLAASLGDFDTFAPVSLQRRVSLVQGRKPQQMHMALMGLGGLGLLSSLVWGGWPGLLGVLSLLGWTAGQALRLAWDAIKRDRELAARLLGEHVYPILLRCRCIASSCGAIMVSISHVQEVVAQDWKVYA